MLRSIPVRIADVSLTNMTVCYNAIRDNTLHSCLKAAANVYDYASYLMFQGLTNATYVDPNSTDITMNGPVMGMINTTAVDTMCILQRCA
jgi:hypothetical protein